MVSSAHKIKVEVYGLMKEGDFYQAKVAAEGLVQKHADVFLPPTCHVMIENQWIQFLDQLRRSQDKKSCGDLWSFNGRTIVFLNNELVGSSEEFLTWAKAEFSFEDFRPVPFFYALAKEEYKNRLLQSKHDFVYMDISIKDDKIGRLLIELFTDKAPQTCENFKRLCIGDKKESAQHDPPLPLAYVGSIFHRIVKNGWIQGGDILHGKGDNGWSIYGETFPDENYSVLHTHRGIIGMANKGPHSNASQFYITLQAASWMDCQYVAFGEVIEGLHVLTTLEDQETYNERPLHECRIRECGVVDVHSMFT